MRIAAFTASLSAIRQLIPRTTAMNRVPAAKTSAICSNIARVPSEMFEVFTAMRSLKGSKASQSAAGFSL